MFFDHLCEEKSPVILSGLADTFIEKNPHHHRSVAEESPHSEEMSPPLLPSLCTRPPSSLLLLILLHSALQRLMLRCGIVTINLNDTAALKAVFVGCESELTRGEKRFHPPPARGLIIPSSPFFSRWREIDLEQRLNSSSKS